MGDPSEKFGLVPWMASMAVVAAAAWLLVHRSPAWSAPEPESGADPVLLELFTSEGCSSCPPADALLSEIGSSRGVIPLAYHVDYWNRLGWSDPFSSPEFSARQDAYARAMNLADKYTPQMVIAGRSQCVGSDRHGIARAVAAARSAPALGTVRLASALTLDHPRTIHIRVRVELFGAGSGGSRELELAVFENGLVSDIGAGENAGRKIAYDYTVRRLLPLKLDSGNGPSEKQISVELDPSWSIGHLGVAAFIQDTQTLQILGAASQFPIPRE